MLLSKYSTLAVLLAVTLATVSCSKNATVPEDRPATSTSGNEPQNPAGDPNQSPNNNGGDSCTVEDLAKGAVIICPKAGTRQVIYDGPAGKDGEDGRDGRDGTSCTTVQVQDGAEIRCTDGTVTHITNGKDGKDGTSCTVEPTQNGADIVCTDGKRVPIRNGKDGKDGENGTSCSAEPTEAGADIVCTDGTRAPIYNGKDGKDGVSCTAEPTTEGADLVCTNGVRVPITNGKDGKDGKDGANGTNGRDGKDGSSCTVKPIDENSSELICEDGSRVVIKVPTATVTNNCEKDKTYQIISTLGKLSVDEVKALHLPYKLDSEMITTISYNDAGDVFGQKQVKNSQVVFALELLLPNRKNVVDLVTAKYEMSAQKLTSESAQFKRSEILCLLGPDVCSGEFIKASNYLSSINTGFQTRSSLYVDKLVETASQQSGKQTLFVKDNLSFNLTRLFDASRAEVLDMLYSNVSEEQSDAPFVKTKLYFVAADDTYIIRPLLHLDLEVNTCDLDQSTSTGSTRTYTGSTRTGETTSPTPSQDEDDTEVVLK